MKIGFAYKIFGSIFWDPSRGRKKKKRVPFKLDLPSCNCTCTTHAVSTTVESQCVFKTSSHSVLHCPSRKGLDGISRSAQKKILNAGFRKKWFLVGVAVTINLSQFLSCVAFSCFRRVTIIFWHLQGKNQNRNVLRASKYVFLTFFVAHKDSSIEAIVPPRYLSCLDHLWR